MQHLSPAFASPDIIRLLAAGEYLTAKEIHMVLNKKKRQSIQAVYKRLLTLQKHGVVGKVGKKYMLKLMWIESVQNFLNSARKNVFENFSNTEQIIPEHGSSFSWHFDNLLDLNIFWGEVTLVALKECPGATVRTWIPHLWIYLFQEQEEKLFTSSLKEYNSKYELLSLNTKLDSALSNTFDYSVTNAYLDNQYQNILGPNAICVQGDFFTQITVSPVATLQIKKIFHKHNTPDDVTTSEIIDLLRDRSMQHTITLHYDAEKAKAWQDKFDTAKNLKL